MVIPINISVKDWFASLVIDFPDDNIPQLNDEKDWKTVGNVISEQTSFSDNGCPFTEGYEEPQPWMEAVYNSMVNF